MVTHAGYLSLEECLCHKVPIVATPICYDQFANADEIEKMGKLGLHYIQTQTFCTGIGKTVKFTEITEDNISQAIDQVQRTTQYQ